MYGKKFGKAALTATAVAMIATAAMTSSATVATAGGKDVAKGAIIGLGLGLLAGSAHRHRDRGHHTRTYVRECWYEKRWYRDEYNRRYFERVKVCD